MTSNISRRKSRVSVLAAVILVGIALLVAQSQISEAKYEPKALTGPVSESLDLDLAQPADFSRDQSDTGSVGAATAIEAVSEFVAAEAAGDFDTSFALLSVEDQQRYRDPAAWKFAHQSLPLILAHEDPGPADDFFATDVQLKPQLNLSVGMMPARATMRFELVEEASGWRVHYAETTVQAKYPPDDKLIPAVQEWASATQACDSTEDLEFESGLLGSNGLADQLCAASGTLEVGEIQSFADLQSPAVLLNAFGPNAGEFIRVVDITAPVAMRVLLAPFDDDWLVVGLSLPSL